MTTMAAPLGNDHFGGLDGFSLDNFLVEPDFPISNMDFLPLGDIPSPSSSLTNDSLACSYSLEELCEPILEIPVPPELAKGPEAKKRAPSRAAALKEVEPKKRAGTRTAAAMERNRRGARKFRERQKQKFLDLTARVETLEAELVAMKLCKLKLEADKTEGELLVKKMEESVSSLHAETEEGEVTNVKEEEGVADRVLQVPNSSPVSLSAVKSLSYTQVFEIYKNYASALRRCLGEVADPEAGLAAQQRVTVLVGDVVTFAVAVQSATSKPVWKLYAGGSGKSEAEQTILVMLGLDEPQRVALAAAGKRYQSALLELARERRGIHAALAEAATPGKDGLKRAQEAMHAMKVSLAREPLAALHLMRSCLLVLQPLQTAHLIVDSFSRTIFPDFVVLCSWVAHSGAVSQLAQDVAMP